MMNDQITCKIYDKTNPYEWFPCIEFVNYMFGRLDGKNTVASLISMIVVGVFIGIYIMLFIKSRKKYKEIVIPVPGNLDKF